MVASQPKRRSASLPTDRTPLLSRHRRHPTVVVVFVAALYFAAARSRGYGPV